MNSFINRIRDETIAKQEELFHRYLHHSIWHCTIPLDGHDYEPCIKEHPCTIECKNRKGAAQ